MNVRQRFKAVMNFQPADRMPAMEWICWWNKTIERWQKEGLPEGMGREDTLRWFGLDVNEWIWITPRKKVPRDPERPRSDGIIRSEADYDRLIAPVLIASPQINRERLLRIAALQEKGEVVVWLQFDGFFWFPREILGVEQHLFAFYDQPQLMHRLNNDLCVYNLRSLEKVLEVFVPDVITFAEDLSYNHGPMLSREQFEEFITPYYQRIVPLAKNKGIITMVDTDGDVTTVVPWLQAAGIEGCLPLERMAGVNVVELRERFPDWKMIGGFDKTVMHLGKEALIKEFERLLPVIKSGGYIPTVDHQTPPEVDLDSYRKYVGLLKEYCREAFNE